ncbi:hypothetical protein ACHAQJ_009621 [Trichoderma viride]
MPVKQQIDDPSWNYCNLAASAVLQIGLREHFQIQSEASDSELVYLKTWLGCFVISTELATDYGLPPPMTFVAGQLSGIKQYTQTYFSNEFWARCELQQYSIQASASLQGITPSQLHTSLLGLLEKDLDSLGGRISSPLPLRFQINLLAAKLRLCAIPLLTLRFREEKTGLNTQTKAVWYKGFHAALQLVSIYSGSQRHNSLFEVDVPASQEVLNSEAITVHYPKHFFCVLSIAGMYLVKFLAVENDLQPEERMLARNKIKEVYETFIAFSSEEMDEHFRTARMIRLLSRHAEDKMSSAYFNDASGDPSTTIIDDSLRIAKKIRERTAVVPQTPDQLIQPNVSKLPKIKKSLEDNSAILEGQLGCTITQDLSIEWNDWHSNIYDDLLGFLGSTSDNFVDDTWM